MSRPIKMTFAQKKDLLVMKPAMDIYRQCFQKLGELKISPEDCDTSKRMISSAITLLHNIGDSQRTHSLSCKLNTLRNLIIVRTAGTIVSKKNCLEIIREEW